MTDAVKVALIGMATGVMAGAAAGIGPTIIALATLKQSKAALKQSADNGAQITSVAHAVDGLTEIKVAAARAEGTLAANEQNKIIKDARAEGAASERDRIQRTDQRKGDK